MVLLFNKTYALFESCAEINDSQDRYANIKVNYLLQRMESQRGSLILTTNYWNSVD